MKTKLFLILALFLIIGLAGKNERFYYIELPISDNEATLFPDGIWRYDNFIFKWHNQPNLIQIRIIDYPTLFFYAQEIE